ncbi:cation-translocating P-type ATPase [Chitinilyticum aquatile]|uniref:cation-translocating P-type ATPase n=1 Tax=Chitinilyticum aquatile TaxID=362520 RepID=UPI00040FFE2A|nr:HAD-IC family P-type ATPase [Chitinilyticum aquatile]
MPANSDPSGTDPRWHALPADEVFARLGSSPAGLGPDECAERLASHGPNQLREKTPRPAWRRFADQFRNLLVIVLLAAGVLAAVVGDLKDAAVIVAVTLINATLGFIQENRAEAALAALKAMLAQTARVRRDGQNSLIPAHELVPGDILLLEAGDRAPADARVLVAHSAEMAEAALTGESHPVPKTPDTLTADTLLAERSNMVYMNTVLTHGRIEAIVTATGMHTEMGRLANLLADTAEGATPLQIQLDQLGKRLALIAGLVVTLIFVLGVMRGDDLASTIMTAIALAVAAIPEGLPAVVTVTLALGMHRMASQHAIVKKLAAVETLGCTTVICSDKTGTLTQNRMTVRQLHFAGQRYQVSGDGYAGGGGIRAPSGDPLPDLRALLLPAALCNDARIHDGELIGDPTEGALLALATRGGIDLDEALARHPRIAEIPFDSAHKFMATFHHDGERVRMWLKGAPDVLLARSSRWHSHTYQPMTLSDLDIKGLQSNTREMANDAMRVLALATRDIPAADFDPAADLMQWANCLTITGLVGMIDPPRPEAAAAIATCQQAGIAVKMITGDHRITAAAIARELGIHGEVCEGSELDRLDDAALARIVAGCAVFARVAPEHKMRIIAALQTHGHVVAMTGDGVNDAPALKVADIGIAMGQGGTAVTREAAAMVLTDDNFASIVHAVKEGRTIYDNIVKFVRFQLSTNLGAIFTVLGAPLLGLPTPFTAIQILWVNIIMDGPPAMTLGVEPARNGIMQTPPRASDAHILTGTRLLRIALYGITMATGTLAAYLIGEQSGGQTYATTLAFTTFVLFQFFNIFNARCEFGSAFNAQFFSNGKLWLALAGVLAMQVLAVHWAPAQTIFSTTDLGLGDWLLAFGIASTTLLLEEARKLGLLLWQKARGR